VVRIRGLLRERHTGRGDATNLTVAAWVYRVGAGSGKDAEFELVDIGDLRTTRFWMSPNPPPMFGQLHSRATTMELVRENQSRSMPTSFVTA